MRSWVIFHFITITFGFLVFVLLFQTSLLSGMVLFYRGIVFLVIAVIVLSCVLVFIKRRTTTTFGYRDIASSVCMFFCITLVFFTHLPVTAERSISVFLLGYLNRNPSKQVSSDEFSRAFSQIYVKENGALEKRYNEQATIDTITREGDSMVITSRGKFLLRFYSWIADIFKIQKSNLSM